MGDLTTTVLSGNYKEVLVTITNTEYRELLLKIAELTMLLERERGNTESESRRADDYCSKMWKLEKELKTLKGERDD